MIKPYLKLYLAITAAALGGCGGNIYSKPDSSTPGVSVVQGKEVRRGAFDYDMYVLTKVDGKTAMRMFQSYAEAKIEVLPGSHVLSVESTINRSAGTACPCRTYNEFEVVIQPSRKYLVTGEASGSQISVWIEDAETKEKVTPIRSALAQPVKKNAVVPVAPGVFVPIPAQ